MRSVAKGNYIKGRDGKAKAISHVRYVQFRKGDDRDIDQGKSRLFYNAERNGISGREVQQYIRNQNDRGVIVHRIVLSPGVDGIDMDAYTRAVMKELGAVKGLDLEYFATNHKNTDHDHAHVVLMGQDKNGRAVRLYNEQYKAIREAGDRYLEHNHYFERYFDKEMPNLMKYGYRADKGDDSFELFLKDMKDPRSFEDIDKERKAKFEQEQHEAKNFDKQKAIAEVPEDEKLNDRGRIFTKYDSLKDLEDYSERLNSGQAKFLPKSEYQMLWTWIGTKRKAGDDFYEKTAEHERLQRLFEDELKRSLAQDDRRPKGFQQYVYESRGRLLESHEQYWINTSRGNLKQELKDLNESEDPDPIRRKQLEEQIKWLDDLPKKAKVR